MVAKLTHITKTFGNQLVFKDLDFDFSKAGMYFIKGKSGIGKTTLLQMIAGFEPFDEGERTIDQNVRIATLFQSFELIPELTVKENVQIYQELYGAIPDEEQLQQMEQLGIQSLLDHYPDEISQGQRQRVAIARTLLQNPSIILCDEPTESLDDENKRVVLDLLYEVSKEKAVIIASHDTSWLIQYEPHIYTFHDHKLQCTSDAFKQEIMAKPECSYQNASLSLLMQRVAGRKARRYAMINFCFTVTLLLLVLCASCLLLKLEEPVMLNPYDIYVRSMSNTARAALLDRFAHAESILPVDAVEYRDQYRKAEAVPLLNDEFNLMKENKLTMQGNEVIINDAMSSVLQSGDQHNLIGETILLHYSFGEYTNRIPMKIVGIITERDMETEAYIYYDLQSMTQWLKQAHIDDSQTEYDLMQASGTDFIIQSNKDEVSSAYEIIEQTKELYYKQPWVDYLRKMRTLQRPYEFAFAVMMAILILAQLLYSLIASRRIFQSHIQFVATLMSCAIPEKAIRSCYRKHHLKLEFKYMVYSLMLLLLAYMLHLLSDVYALTLVLVFILTKAGSVLSLMMITKSIRKDRISISLKQQKDQEA